MQNKHFSFKRIQIDKDNAHMMIIVGVAAFITVFCFFASKALLSQRAYQAQVIGKKEQARDQLKANIQAKDSLVISYKQFVDQPENIIGGDPDGEGENDGDNGRIILDALPSKYDFPALTSTLEKLLNDQAFVIGSIAGTDEEVAQQEAAQSDQVTQPVEMPFQITVNGSYSGVKDLVRVFERSIRPIKLKQVSLSGSDSSMRLDITAVTYFQPEKKITIKKETVE